MMKKRIAGMILFMILLVIVPAMATAALYSKEAYIDGVLLVNGANTNKYSYTQNDDGDAVLTLKSNATVGKIEIGNLNMTIKPQSNVTVTNGIGTGFKNDEDKTAWTMPPLTISGGTLKTKYISAEGGLSIQNGAHVTAENDSGNAVFVTGYRRRLGISGGSTLIAKSTKENTEAIYLYNLYRVDVSDGSTLIASGYHGLRVNDPWNEEINMTVSGGSTLDVMATGNDSLADAIDMKINSDHIGTVRLEDTSVLKVRASNKDRLLNCYTDFTSSYEWKTSDGGSVHQYPYEDHANQSAYTYLEVKPNKVFVPKISPADATITYGESQTFTVSSANGVAADGIAYQWYLDGTAISGATGSSYTVSNPAIKNRYTVSCNVWYNGVGPATVSSKLSVLAIDSSNADIKNMDCTFYDVFNPVVTLGGRELVRGTDYDLNTGSLFLSVGAPINLASGEYDVTVNFKGNYKGSKTAKLKVKAANLADCTVTCGQDTFQYDGASHTPRDITVTYKGYPLEEYEFSVIGSSVYDYELPFLVLTSIAPGTYDYQISAGNSGKFTGSTSVKYTITKATLTAEKVNLEQQEYTYGDTFTKPASLTWTVPGFLESYDHVMTLAGGDYTLPAGRVGDVTDNGSAKLTFTDKAKYCTGDLEFSYKVKPKEIDDGDVTIEPTLQTYTGGNVMPAVSVAVKLGSDTAATNLTKETDFTATVPDSNGNPVEQIVKAGTYTLTVKGKNNYTGEVTRTVTVNRANLADCTVAISQKAFLYNGSSQVPAVQLTYMGRDVSAAEYDVTYLDEKGDIVASPTDAGIYTVNLTAKNVNFTGTKTAEFRITAAEPDVDLKKFTFTYGDLFTQPASFVWNGMTLSAGVDYDLPFGRVGNVTTDAAAQITFRGGSFKGKMDFSYEVKPKTIAESDVTLSNTSFVYNGTDQTPTILVSVKLGSDTDKTTLVSGTDYTVTVTNRNVQTVTEMKNAGTYTVQVKGIGNYDGEVENTCIVGQASTSLKATLGDAEEEPVLYGEYTYGEAFTVTATAKPSGMAGRMRLFASASEPAARQMALFLGGKQITEPVDEENGRFVMTYDTTGQALAIGDNKVIAQYVGDANMADQYQELTVHLKQRELKVMSLTAQDRVYEPGNDRVQVTEVTVSGILESDEVAVDMTGLTARIASENAGVYNEAALDHPVKLTGEDAGYYVAAGTSVPVTGGVEIARAIPTASGSSDTNGDGVAETDPVFDPVYRDGRTLGSVPVSLPENAYNVPGTIAWSEPADTVIEEGKAYAWIFTPDSPNYLPVTGLAVIYPVGDPPVIISPKKNQEITVRASAGLKLSIKAKDAMSYQWYVDNGSGWKIVRGQTSPTLSIAKVPAACNGYRYRCMASNLYGDTFSPVFTVFVFTDLPETGDHSSMTLWFALLALCGAGLLAVRRRRENR